MLDDYNFIVNTKNNMVVTAIGKQEKNVFTNIDGAVIAQEQVNVISNYTTGPYGGRYL